MRADSHTVLAQACVTVLLQGPDITNDAGSMPLVGAEHWVTHAQVKNVMSRVCDGLEYLFDPAKPYFEAWVQSHNFDHDHASDTHQILSLENGHCITLRYVDCLS